MTPQDLSRKIAVPVSAVAGAATYTGDILPLGELVLLGSMGSGTYQLEGSNDGLAWSSIGAAQTGNSSLSITDSWIWIRWNCSVYASGTPVSSVTGPPLTHGGGSPGPRGATGAAGAAGATGAAGAPGATGAAGAAGAAGATGATGPAPSGTGNQVVATPANGSTAAAALRALVAADLPARYLELDAVTNSFLKEVAHTVTVAQSTTPGVNGPTFTLSGGKGANADASHAAGVGSIVDNKAGDGGDGDATHQGGAGGAKTIRGGQAGADGGAGGGQGGKLWLAGGLNAAGTAADGIIQIGVGGLDRIYLGDATAGQLAGGAIVTAEIGAPLRSRNFKGWSWVDSANFFGATASNVNQTYGRVFGIAHDSYAYGARFYWPGGKGALTVRCKLWLASGGAALSSIDVAVNAAGIYTGVFAASQTLDAYKPYLISTWEISGNWAVDGGMSDLQLGRNASCEGLFSVGEFNGAHTYGAGDTIPTTTKGQISPVECIVI